MLRFRQLIRSSLIMGLVVGYGLTGPVALAEDFINIKILAVNPSKAQSLQTEVLQLLPPEVKPEDVVDAADMEIRYDSEKKSYYVAKQVTLAPSETRNIVVRVRNVWVLTEDQLGEIRSEIDDKMQSLEGTKYGETASLLYQKALERLDQIEEEAQRPIGVKQQIELYRSHMKQIEEIKGGLLSMNSLRKLDVNEEERVANFMITAENPSSEPRKMNIRAALPKDVKSEDVLEKQDFVMLFDSGQSAFILEKVDDFGPKEVKKYKITLRDVWYIPKEELDYILTTSAKLEELFEGSNYEEYVSQGLVYMRGAIDEINSLQEQITEDTSINERIRTFVLNSQKLKLVKKKLRELQDLVLELPLKKPEENVLEQLKRGIKEIQKIADVAKLLSMGIDPEVSTTWWIIFGIMLFLAILTCIFYVTWLSKLKKSPYNQTTQAKK